MHASQLPPRSSAPFFSPPAGARESPSTRAATPSPSEGAQLFATHCAGCHTISAAGTQGSGNRALRIQGPNFDQRVESYDEALFAIRNGGFSGAIMPQNIVVGDDAAKVAEFLAKYSGSDVDEAARPTAAPAARPASPTPPRTRSRAPTTRRARAPAPARLDRTSSAESPTVRPAASPRATASALLDLRRIREDPAPARAALARVGAAEDLDRLLELDARRRELLPEVEGLRAERNDASDAIGAAKREGSDGAEAIAAMRDVSARIKQLEAELAEVVAARDELAASIPNPPDPDAPDGDTDEDAVVLREVGEQPSLRLRGPRPPRPRPRARPDRDREGGRRSPARASPT